MFVLIFCDFCGFISVAYLSILAEPEQGEITSLTRGRKRSRNTAEWKANKRQRLRQSGKQYTSIRGKLVDERTVKTHKSDWRFQCSEKFSDADRQIIHDGFLEVKWWRKKTLFCAKYRKGGQSKNTAWKEEMNIKGTKQAVEFSLLPGAARQAKSM